MAIKSDNPLLIQLSRRLGTEKGVITQTEVESDFWLISLCKNSFNFFAVFSLGVSLLQAHFLASWKTLLLWHETFLGGSFSAVFF